MDLLTREVKALDPDDPRTVLIVEDEMMVRMPIAEYLRDCGYHVLEASDASEAIAVMDADKPINLVFSDVRMPGQMDGFGLAAWFQSRYPTVPVLLTSGYNGGRSLPPTSSSGTRFIEKPYSQKQVAQHIAALLAA
jgi:CheY-like chemotaxis protein